MLRGLGLTGLVVTMTTVALASPGAAAHLDSKRLERQVADAARPVYPDLPIGKVRCPKRIHKKVGTTAICEVDAGGLLLRLRVTQTDRSGAARIESTQAVIPEAKAEELVRDNSTVPAEVDCGPDPYIVRPPGDPFWCTARFADGAVQRVLVSARDVAGNATITRVL